jgi:4-hydroxybenzoate polyprenyltransferase
VNALNRLTHKLSDYEKLMRLDKPIGILLLLWPTLWALWFASNGQPNWIIAWVLILGTVLMRSAGCVINDVADRKIDPHVARTKDRPVAAGRVSIKEALVLFVLLVLLSFALVLMLQNTLVLMLSVPALFLAGSYPFTKRFFAIPQAYLGIAFGFGIPIAFAAQLEWLPRDAWWLLLANIFWAIAYDTAYAMVDRPDDLKIGIKTSAITFGRYEVTAIMLCYAVALGLITWVGHNRLMGWAFYIGMAIAAVIAGYHYTLIKDRDGVRCFKAFLHNNYLGGVIFVAIVAGFLTRR